MTGCLYWPLKYWWVHLSLEFILLCGTTKIFWTNVLWLVRIKPFELSKCVETRTYSTWHYSLIFCGEYFQEKKFFWLILDQFHILGVDFWTIFGQSEEAFFSMTVKSLFDENILNQFCIHISVVFLIFYFNVRCILIFTYICV